MLNNFVSWSSLINLIKITLNKWKDNIFKNAFYNFINTNLKYQKLKRIHA